MCGAYARLAIISKQLVQHSNSDVPDTALSAKHPHPRVDVMRVVEQRSGMPTGPERRLMPQRDEVIFGA
jgi:hypothetical protein